MEHPPISIAREELLAIIEENLSYAARVQGLLKDVGRYEDRARAAEEIAQKLIKALATYSDPAFNDGGELARKFIEIVGRDLAKGKK